MKKTDKTIADLIITFSIMLMIVSGMIWLKMLYRPEIKGIYLVNMGLDIFGLAVILVMINGPGSEIVYGSRAHEIFRIELLTVAIALYADIIAWLVQDLPYFRTINLIDNLLFFACGLVSPFVFYKYLRSSFAVKKEITGIFDKIIHVVFAAGLIALLLNAKFGYYFTVDSKGVYKRSGTTYMLSNLPVAVMIIIGIIYIIISNIKIRERIAFVLYYLSLIPVIVVQTMIFGLSVLYPASLVVLILVYNKVQQRRNLELMVSKSSLLLQQIKPHFVQNCLANIRGLMYEDVDKAEELLMNLSGYLKNSYMLLDEMDCVPFSEEMALVDEYLNIEMARFPGKIEITKDIDNADFMLPPLTIEPLVENAVRHGIRGKEETGHINISVRNSKNNVEITISDDGVGFDASSRNKKGHIGINNVETRLELMVKGSLTIDSKHLVGTTVKVIIPHIK